jgi:hypothetical protein
MIGQANIGEILTAASHIGVVAALGLFGAALFRKSFRAGWFVAGLALYALYDGLLTRGFFFLPDVFPDASWNWTGKLMSLAGILAVAALPAIGWRRAGITLRQAPGSAVAIVVLAALAGLFFYLAISGADGRDDWETIAFQWTMPGLDEEIFYRGVFLLAMNEAFAARWRILGASIGYGGLIATVLFGLAHGLAFEKGGFTFDAMTFAMTGGPALILLWLRERTGSVLLPIIGHNIANGASTLF